MYEIMKTNSWFGGVKNSLACASRFCPVAYIFGFIWPECCVRHATTLVAFVRRDFRSLPALKNRGSAP